MNKKLLAGTVMVIALVGIVFLLQKSGDNKTVIPSSSEEQNSPASLVEEKASNALSQMLGIPINSIDIIETKEHDWTDSCLGLGTLVESCLQVITPGYQITLKADGKEFRYRTNNNGSVIRQDTSESFGHNITYPLGKG